MLHTVSFHPKHQSIYYVVHKFILNSSRLTRQLLKIIGKDQQRWKEVITSQNLFLYADNHT